MLWALAVLTAFLTATYMFRLLYLAFFGERRQAPAARGARHTARTARRTARPRRARRTAAHLHDAPPAMAIALVVLAIGSVLAGYVGVPHVLGGGNRIEAFLEPSFRARRARPSRRRRRPRPAEPARPSSSTRRN